MIRPPPLAAALIVAATLAVGCTQESQNQLGRSIQNWTGTNGVLEVYAGEKLVKRFLRVDKLSTAYGTSDAASRPYRFGYGIYDTNLDFEVSPGEKKVYFEISAFQDYVFFEDPR